MAAIKEISGVYHLHQYHLSTKTAIWATILILLIMIALYPALNFPPNFGSFSSGIYFHAIGLSIVALMSYLVLFAFGLERYAPVLDFPISYRALVSTVLAAIAGILFLTPSLSSIPVIPTLVLVTATLFTIDITGALLIELFLLPRKLHGTYDSRVFASLGTIEKMVKFLPFEKGESATYPKMDAAYWLVLIGLGSLFISELIGFVVLAIIIFPSFVQYLGMDPQTLFQAALDPHSHGTAVAIIAIVIGTVVQRFGVLRSRGWKMNLTRLGVWLATLSLILLTLVYVAGALVNYSPPTLLQSGPDGINGIAGDDILISGIFAGALLSLVPLAFNVFRKKSSWKDPVRLGLLLTILSWFVVNTAAGFYIELHQDVFSTTLLANDMAYAQVQPMFGIFFLMIIALVLLAVDYYEVGGKLRKYAGWSASLGIVVASVGGLAWVFLEGTPGILFWVYILGSAIILVSMVIAVKAIFKTKVIKIRLTEKTPKSR